MYYSKEKINKKVVKEGLAGVINCLNGQDYERGQIETIEAEINILQAAVARLLLRLPTDEVAEIIFISRMRR